MYNLYIYQPRNMNDLKSVVCLAEMDLSKRSTGQSSGEDGNNPNGVHSVSVKSEPCDYVENGLVTKSNIKYILVLFDTYKSVRQTHITFNCPYNYSA